MNNQKILKTIACIYSEEMHETASSFCGIMSNELWKSHPYIEFKYSDWTEKLSLQTGVSNDTYQAKIDEELLKEADVIIAFIRRHIGDGLKKEIEEILKLKGKVGLGKPFFRVYFEGFEFNFNDVDCQKLKRLCEFKESLKSDAFLYKPPFIKNEASNLYYGLLVAFRAEIEINRILEDKNE